jgi:hypothetical protein
MTVEGLKDFLSWNGQIQKGNKDFRLFKVIDGELHGRLSQCPLCQGNLKFIEEDYDKVCFIKLTYIYIYIYMNKFQWILLLMCSYIYALLYVPQFVLSYSVLVFRNAILS